MSIASLIIPSFLAALGLGVIYVFIRLIFSNIRFDSKSFFEMRGLKKRTLSLSLAGESVKRGDFNSARTQIENSFYLTDSVSKESFLDLVNRHHEEVLSQIVLFAESKSAHFSNLAIIEGLLQSRSELLRAILELEKTKEKLKAKRKEKGTPTPDWAFEEFSRKLSEVKDRLQTNRKSFDSQLKELLQELARAPVSSEITYH